VTEPPRSLIQRYGLKTLVSLVIAGAFIWALTRAGLPIVPGKREFEHTRWSWVAVHAVILMVVHVIRAARWRHLLRPLSPGISTRRIVAASWIGFTGILLLPLRMGEIVRPLLVRDGKRITMSSALGTIGAERVIDGLVVTAVLAGALVMVPRLSPLPDHVGDLKIPVSAIPAAGYLTLVVFIGAFVAMAIFYFARGLAQRLIHATFGLVSEKLAARVAGIVGGLADGLHFFADKRHGVPFILETAVYWALNAIGMFVLGIAVGLPMTFGHACAVMGVLAVGILVPAGPGLFGAFQAASYGALAMYFAPAIVTSEGAAYVFLLYSVQFVWHLIAAGIAVAIQPDILRNRA
jgi:uncharacterized protein (TIRG00374 family)